MQRNGLFKCNDLGQLMYGTPLKWLIMLAPLGMAFWLSARISHMSATKARNLFYVYGAIMGLSLASILLVYTGASVARAFSLLLELLPVLAFTVTQA